MLVIGHRGAAGLATENTLDALWAGFYTDADILEFDVRLTSDNIPVLSHDPQLHGKRIRQTTYADLKKAGQVTTLKSVLDAFFGKIMLNLEYKPITGVEIVYDLINKKYVKHPDDWSNILFSSFHVGVLRQLRHLSNEVNIALLHSINPFAFVTYHRRLRLAAVGWHRLHVNKLSIEVARKADIFSYVYTVNRPEAAKILELRGVDGIVTDYPDRIIEKFER
jgi:glycerophosphoryl diester phosphodiesterase